MRTTYNWEEDDFDWEDDESYDSTKNDEIEPESKLTKEEQTQLNKDFYNLIFKNNFTIEEIEIMKSLEEEMNG